MKWAGLAAELLLPEDFYVISWSQFMFYDPMPKLEGPLEVNWKEPCQ